MKKKQWLAYALGRGVRGIIMKYTIEVGSVNKSIDMLKSLKVDIFLKKRNKVLMSFLDGRKDNTRSENLSVWPWNKYTD